MDSYTFTDEETISRIAEQCPRAMSAYFLCLHNCNSSGECHFTKETIKNQFMHSWTKFKNDLRSLSRLSILEFGYTDEFVAVKLCEVSIGAD